MNRSLPTALALIAALWALPAMAGGGQDAAAVVDHIFEQADLDGDGVLDAEEYAQAELERYGLSFEQSDTNGDGGTSKAEYLELYEAHHPPSSCEDDLAV